MNLIPRKRCFRCVGFVLALPLAASTVRIIQTNSAGDNIHIIDPSTNKVVGIISGIEVSHGAAAAPDGSRYYFSDEAESTLDVVDQKTLKVTNRIPLSGHPNNIAISKDGRRIYVAIAVAPGAVDVVDTVSMQNVKTIPVQGAVHNTYVTPDFVYSAGADFAVSQRVSLRLGYRGHVFEAPAFGIDAIKTGLVAHLAEPFVGLSFHF